MVTGSGTFFRKIVAKYSLVSNGLPDRRWTIFPRGDRKTRIIFSALVFFNQVGAIGCL
jgi:hypothetical protein